MAGVTRPQMQEGAEKEFVDALHDLYERAGRPTLKALGSWASNAHVRGMGRSTIQKMLKGTPETLSDTTKAAALIAALQSFISALHDDEESSNRIQLDLLNLHAAAFRRTVNSWGSNISDHFARLVMQWGEDLDGEPRAGVQGVVTIACPNSERTFELGAFAPPLHFAIVNMLERDMYLRFGTTARLENVSFGPTWWAVWGGRGLERNKNFNSVLLYAVRLDALGVVSVYFRDCLPDAGGYLVEHLAFDAWAAATQTMAEWGLSGPAHATFLTSAIPRNTDARYRVGSGHYSSDNYKLDLVVPTSTFQIAGWARNQAAPFVADIADRRREKNPVTEGYDPVRAAKVTPSIPEERLDQLFADLRQARGEEGLSLRLKHLQSIRRRWSIQK